MASLEHEATWDSRLQDWVDRTLNAAEQSAVEAHLAQCLPCRQRRDELLRLDRSLRRLIRRPQLDANFDRHLMAQVDRLDRARRHATRQRAERELKEELQVLAQRWRRCATLLMPAMLAGSALAVALASGLGVTAMLGSFLAQVADLSPPYIQAIQIFIVGATGAGVGGAAGHLLATRR